jgi:indole-3-acetate monooxygenase
VLQRRQSIRSPSSRLQKWLATANDADCAADAVDLVRSLAGTTGVFQGNKLERCWRDVHLVTQHAQAASANYGAAGAYRLGLGVKMLDCS